MSTQVDLRQLAVRREPADGQPPRRRRPHWLSRYLFPAVVLLGFGSVLAWAARDSLLPSRPVTVVPVMTSRAEVRQEGAPLFQAAGWVEPRPTPTLVTALAEGVIDKLLVVEGQEVKAGEPVALLIDEDAKIALRAAEADVKLRRAEVAGYKAALAAARTNFQQPTQLTASYAESSAMTAQKETEIATLPFLIESAKAKARLARFNHEQRMKSGSAVSDLELEQSKREMEAAAASAHEYETRLPALKNEIEKLRERCAALHLRLELKTNEKRALADGEAQVEAAEARLQQAIAARDAAKLRLDRMVVRAPSHGLVLGLLSRPGMRMMGMTPGTLADASTVVSLYDPERLQVRADVLLEDVPRLRPGMRVKIATPAAANGPLDGEVLYSTSLADIQKNTLQVKVAILSPPPTIRPDMLVQATFLAPPPPKSADPASEPLRLLVYRRFVESGEGGSHVWVADLAAGVARKKTVQLGPAMGDFVEVVSGLTAGDRLISDGRDGLNDGQRIHVSGEDTALMSTAASTPEKVHLQRLSTPNDHKIGQ